MPEFDICDAELSEFPKRKVFHDLAHIRPTGLIFGAKCTARRAQSGFDTFEAEFSGVH